MLNYLRKIIGHDSVLRLFYHKLWAITATFWYRFPANKMVIIGVTGTDGKTTTCRMVYEILKHANLKVGLCSSTEFAIGDKIWRNTSHRTTLGRFKLQKILRQMANANCSHVIIETSSHSLKQHRTWGISYNLGLLTNLSPEHLDYHKTMEDYRASKYKIFSNLLKNKGVAVLNMDDQDNFKRLSPLFTSNHQISFGLNHRASVTAKDIVLKPTFSKFNIKIINEELPVHLKLAGDFNIKNALGAAALATSLKISPKIIKQGLESLKIIPGRMEKIPSKRDFTVMIDFAMTPDGYQNLLRFLKKTVIGKLWVVFGCCGDRDKDKRSLIGKIVAEYADEIIITDDEPYTEDPQKIRAMIEKGIQSKNYHDISDRRLAIKFAIDRAKKDDLIVVSGMGDLEGRTFGTEIKPWSDREIIKVLLLDNI